MSIFETSNNNPKKQGDIGEAMAIYQLTKAGYTVSIPICDSAKYDLIVELGGVMLRVQVKTSRYRIKSGNYEFNLATSFSNTARTTRVNREKEDYDALFCAGCSGDFWFVPEASISSKKSVVMGTKYTAFKNKVYSNGRRYSSFTNNIKVGS